MACGTKHWKRGWQIAGGLLLFTVAVRAEPQMAIEDGTKLYQNRMLKGELARGEIVDTRAYPENEDWVWVKRGDDVFLARRSELKSRVDMETDYAVFVEKAEADLRTVKRDVMVALTQRQQLAEAIRLVQLDELLYFRTRKPSLTVVNPVSGGDPTVAVTTRYSYDRLISSAQSGRLQRDWGGDLDAVNEELGKLWRNHLAIETELAKRAAEIDVVRLRFAAHAAGDTAYLAVPYVVTERSAVLYQNRAATDRLSRGDIVRAWPHEQYRGWLNTVIEGDIYQVDGRNLADALALTASMQRDVLADQLRIAQLESDIEFARFLEALLSRLSLQLEYGTRGGDYIVVSRFGPIAPPNRLHAIDHDGEAVVVYRRGSGRRTLRDWEEACDFLVKERRTMEGQARDLRGRVIRTQAEIEKLRKVLDGEQGEKR